MYNRRVYNTDTFNKMDGLLFYLQNKKLEYTVSFEREYMLDEKGEMVQDPERHKSTVTWYGE